jgi:protein PET100
MGNWKLEAFKMSIYMMFPVGCFWFFNQPGIFEDWIMQKRKLLYTPEDPAARKQLEQVIEQMELQRQARLEEQMSKSKSSSQSDSVKT